MSEIGEQKSSLINLLVGLYIKKTYFRITRSRGGVFFPSQDEVADQFRGILAEALGPQQAQAILSNCIDAARTLVHKAMGQVRFDPASECHTGFCKELTDPANADDIEALRERMKTANDRALADAISALAQANATLPHQTPLQEPVTDLVTTATPPSLSSAPSGGYEPVGRLALDREILSSGDRLIEKATSGKFRSLESVFSKLVEADRIAISKPAIAPSAQIVPAHGSYPEGRPHQVKAADLFADALRHPSDADKLDFPVTIFEWSGQHPRVPNIDHSHRFDIEQLRLILWAMDRGYNSVLTGPPGCGKTTVTREVAGRLRRPWYRIPMHGDMGKRDMLGGFKQISTHQGPETRWFDGLLTQAITQPAVIDVDEIDRADPDLQYIAHQLYEGEGITILEDEGRFVPPHPKVALLATANTKGRADSLNRYQMINEMSEATRDRFSVWVDMDYAPPDEEAEILTERGIIKSPSAATNIIKVANLIRAAYKKGEISTTCSFRQLEAAADLASFYGDECEAVRRILYARAPTLADAKTIYELAHQIYGPSWNPPAPF
ncbi:MULTISPECIES: AAA family ATPase [Microvirga]|uniref:AAA family ATPase n=1 Tax=Microvirga TaxID=186650 RepID=UPI0021C6692A|nr:MULTISPECIES: MoxR family ATPase [unclassified Microvirga]